MKPIIAINVDLEDGPPQRATVQATYFQAVIKAGGIPVLLAPMPAADLEELFQTINGLMLIGGNDYNPQNWGESPSEKVHLTSSAREEFDLQLVQEAIKLGKLPLLGICAGAQALNIALGGSLIQDIPTELPESHVQHSTMGGWSVGFNRHRVRLAASSKLAKIYKQLELSVPTSHHQSVRQLGNGLQATAFADDDVIEAVEFSEHPFAIGVQWHPERDYEGNKELFEEFVKQAAGITLAVSK